MRPLFFRGTRAFLRNGPNTQTVRICDPRNTHGSYDWVLRLVRPLLTSRDELAGLSRRGFGPAELVAWLRAERGATVEAGPGRDVLPDPAVGPYAAEGDPWVREAVALLEGTLDRFVQAFLASPYLHRVEHSLHTLLIDQLREHPPFRERVPLAHGAGETQVLHKEWPETIPCPGHRRGNFDVSILPPQAIRRRSLLEFLDGAIPAPIVVEVGLDYDAAHLREDHEKLVHSEVPFGYLLHLVRNVPDDPAVERLLLEPTTGIKTAYGRVHGTSVSFKLLGDTAVTRR